MPLVARLSTPHRAVPLLTRLLLHSSIDVCAAAPCRGIFRHSLEQRLILCASPSVRMDVENDARHAATQVPPNGVHVCNRHCSTVHYFGNVYKCETTGEMHVCDKNCQQHASWDKYSFICPLSRKLSAREDVELPPAEFRCDTLLIPCSGVCMPVWLSQVPFGFGGPALASCVRFTSPCPCWPVRIGSTGYQKST